MHGTLKARVELHLNITLLYFNLIGPTQLPKLIISVTKFLDADRFRRAQLYY
jgi:hypothetical protein